MDDFRRLMDTQYHCGGWREDSGLPYDTLREQCFHIAEKYGSLSPAESFGKVIRHILTHARIRVDSFDWFADHIDMGDITPSLRGALMEAHKRERQALFPADYGNALRCLAWTGDCDFYHTSPDWGRILSLGLPGLLEQVRAHRDNSHAAFYDGCEQALLGAEEFARRLAAEAGRKSAEAKNQDEKSRMALLAESLSNLSCKRPGTLHEAMELTVLWYCLQHTIEGSNVRTLGNLGYLYQPFYRADLASGRCTEARAREYIRDFLLKFGALHIDANMPFTVGGRAEDGSTKVTPFTYLILEEYRKLDIRDPKMHVFCGEEMPDDFLELLLGCVREGKNSFVFLNTGTITRALEKTGETRRDAERCTVVGCYEACAEGKEVAGTCNGRVSLPKAVEAAMNDGLDPLTGLRIGPSTGRPEDFETFEAFYEAVKTHLRHFAEASMQTVRAYEKFYPSEKASPFLSCSLADCLEQGVDAFSGGARYNTSSINVFGLATAVDSLVAVKEAVFKEHRLTLWALAAILKANFAKDETLRKVLLNRYPKYGNNNPVADAIAADLVREAAAAVNGKPNGRSGVFRLGMFSIDWRVEFGQKTGATPDGRFAHEPISKNIGADTARDKNGVTAHILSATTPDYTLIPNGTALDLTMHASAATGRRGMAAMKALLRAFLERNGFAMHLNVLDPSVLRSAQINPDNYRTLQVRLCGWNVYFVNLSKAEQDEFIRESEVSAV